MFHQNLSLNSFLNFKNTIFYSVCTFCPLCSHHRVKIVFWNVTRLRATLLYSIQSSPFLKNCSPTGRRNHGRPLKRLLDTWDRNGSTRGLTAWQIYNDDDDEEEENSKRWKETRKQKKKIRNRIQIQFLIVDPTYFIQCRLINNPPILDKLLEYKRNWIHVNRMPRNILPRVMKHYSPTGRRNHGRHLKRLLDTWDRNGSKSGPTAWQIYDDYDDEEEGNTKRWKETRKQGEKIRNRIKFQFLIVDPNYFIQCRLINNRRHAGCSNCIYNLMCQ
jgi:hypothetical protein